MIMHKVVIADKHFISVNHVKTVSGTVVSRIMDEVTLSVFVLVSRVVVYR